jgi:hypothetical protein
LHCERVVKAQLMRQCLKGEISSLNSCDMYLYNAQSQISKRAVFQYLSLSDFENLRSGVCFIPLSPVGFLPFVSTK